MPDPTRPLIGVNADFTLSAKTITPHLRLAVGYVDAIVAASGLPVVLPPMCKDIDPDAILDRLDGVLLSGGLDLDPRRHGLPTHTAVHLMPERRDDSDRLLVRHIVERRLPVLGVGLGMQQLNVALGGTLFLHLPDEQPGAMPHRDAAGMPHRHLVLVEPNTRLEEIYGGGEIRVNSAHHQAVRQAAPGLRVCAGRRMELSRPLKPSIRIGSASAFSGIRSRKRPRRWMRSCSSVSSRRVCAKRSRCRWRRDAIATVGRMMPCRRAGSSASPPVPGADEVDAALLEVEGVGLDVRPRLIGSLHQPYGPELKDLIRRASGSAPCDTRDVSLLHRLLGESFAAAARAVADQASLSLQQVQIIGCSGHTVWHDTEGRFPSTLSLGMAAVVAERCGVTTVNDFRGRDMAAGGQGLPLAALTDYLLFRSARESRILLHLGATRESSFCRLAFGRRDQRLRGRTLDVLTRRHDASSDQRTSGVRRGREARGSRKMCGEVCADMARAPLFLPPTSEMSTASSLR